MSKRKPTAADIVMGELLWYGGEQKTRKEIFDEMLAEGFEKRYVDFYLFCLANHQSVVTDEPAPIEPSNRIAWWENKEDEWAHIEDTLRADVERDRPGAPGSPSRTRKRNRSAGGYSGTAEPSPDAPPPESRTVVPATPGPVQQAR